MKKIKYLIVIAVVSSVIISSLPFLAAPGMIGAILDGLKEKLFANKLTVGQITVAGAEIKGISIRESDNAAFKDNISPVIGKAYRIERTGGDSPIRVEFSYDPSQIKPGAPEASLKIYKREEISGVGYWSPIPSVADTEKKIVAADLTSFSILAVRAPVAYYFGEDYVRKINKELADLEKELPKYTCGKLIIVEEELIVRDDIVVWKEEDTGSDIVESYSRTPEEQIEQIECKGNSSVYTGKNKFEIKEREINYKPAGSSNSTQKTAYTINAYVVWQTDPEESAVVKGRVTDQDGKPLSGVSISAVKIKYDPSTKDIKTDGNGNYELKVHSGEYLITANNGGGNDASKMFEDAKAGKPVPNNAELDSFFGYGNQDGDNDKNCDGGSWRERLYEFGTLKNPVAGHGPWRKDFTLICHKYDLEQDVSLPTEFGTMGLNFKGTETVKMKGKLVKQEEGGYGWEGIWAVDVKFETVTKFGDSIHATAQGLPGWSNIGNVSGTSKNRDRFVYLINLPLGLKKGDAVKIAWFRPMDGYETQTYEIGGNKPVSGPGGSAVIKGGPGSSGVTTAKSVYYENQAIIENVPGNEGVIIKLLGDDGRYPPAKIEKIKKADL